MCRIAARNRFNKHDQAKLKLQDVHLNFENVRFLQLLSRFLCSVVQEVVLSFLTDWCNVRVNLQLLLTVLYVVLDLHDYDCLENTVYVMSIFRG